MNKILSITGLVALSLSSTMYAADPLILSLNVTQQNSKFSLPGSENKSKGYTVIKGKKKLDVGVLAKHKGGRGNIAKKKHQN